MCWLVHCLIQPEGADRMRMHELNDCINNRLIHCSYFPQPQGQFTGLLRPSNEFSCCLSSLQPSVKTDPPPLSQRTRKVNFEECTWRPGCFLPPPSVRGKNLIEENMSYIRFFFQATEEWANCVRPPCAYSLMSLEAKHAFVLHRVGQVLKTTTWQISEGFECKLCCWSALDHFVFLFPEQEENFSLRTWSYVHTGEVMRF